MADDVPFLSRWSQRKALARHGQPLPEPVPPPATPPAPAAARPPLAEPGPVRAPVQGPVLAPPAAAQAPGAGGTSTAPVPAAAAAAPTLDDVARLPADASDFSRFVARGVQPEVKNAALKKLFSDPHFNVMDGLDIYIDDYGKPDPLPAAMLRQMVQSRFLGLFDDEQAPEPARRQAAGSAGLPSHSIATAAATAPQDPQDRQAPPAAPAPHDPPAETAPAALPHEDADLRLQPHPAAGPEGAAAGADPAPGRQP